MSFRTSLQRLTRRDPEKPSLRERLAATADRLSATKDRAGKAAKVARIMMKPPEPEPEPVPRTTLVNYASWLFMERRLVCAELYPHLGTKAASFVVAAQPADDFHFPTGDRRQDVPPPSTRAVKILDMIGVDWRSDTDPDWGVKSFADDGTRPVLPPGWPAVDAELVSALGDLRRLDAATTALIDADPRDAVEIPGYEALEEARDDALDTLKRERARGLPGLQAKAHAILTTGVRHDHKTTASLAQSLARNLLGVRQSAIEPKPDPIFAAIEEGRRLSAKRDACLAVSGLLPDDAPEWEREHEAHCALWGHWRQTLLTTVPTTAAGCTALARYANAFLKAQGVDEGRDTILANIARSPLL